MLFTSHVFSDFSYSLPVNTSSHKTGISLIDKVIIWELCILEKCFTQFSDIKNYLLIIYILGLQPISNESI